MLDIRVCVGEGGQPHSRCIVTGDSEKTVDAGRDDDDAKILAGWLVFATESGDDAMMLCNEDDVHTRVRRSQATAFLGDPLSLSWMASPALFWRLVEPNVLELQRLNLVCTRDDDDELMPDTVDERMSGVCAEVFVVFAHRFPYTWSMRAEGGKGVGFLYAQRGEKSQLVVCGGRCTAKATREILGQRTREHQQNQGSVAMP